MDVVIFICIMGAGGRTVDGQLSLLFIADCSLFIVSSVFVFLSGRVVR